MIKGRDFIVFSDDWGRHPFSCQHIMKRFLPHNRILWVNTIGMRPPSWSLYDVRRSLEKLAHWVGPRSKANGSGVNPENLSVVSPLGIPFNMVPAIRDLNARIGLSAVGRAIKENNLKDPIVITTLPNTVDCIGHLGEVVSVYYCVDDFTVYPDLPTKMIANMERELLKKVDLVVATARELQMRKSNGVRDTVLLPHGVDAEHFSRHVGRNVPSPDSMQGMQHPVMGFFGVIGEWVDLELIARMAELREDWTWVLIGPSQTNVQVLQTCPNIFLLGSVNYQDLPSYARHFDVGIIPFVINDLTINVNPLKLLEYLACGLPVVSTPLPEVSRYGNLVETADTPEEFVAAIERAMASNVQGQAEKRILLARGNSWDVRAEEFSHHIEEFLKSRRQCA
jgi:glycosyltransferase involved in cell wall biosynthesis